MKLCRQLQLEMCYLLRSKAVSDTINVLQKLCSCHFYVNYSSEREIDEYGLDGLDKSVVCAQDFLEL